jgi:hypothetical protein
MNEYLYMYHSNIIPSLDPEVLTTPVASVLVLTVQLICTKSSPGIIQKPTFQRPALSPSADDCQNVNLVTCCENSKTYTEQNGTEQNTRRVGILVTHTL